MSLLRGDDDSSWSLPSTVDALASAARQVQRPGGIWLAGLAYQFIVLSWSFGSLVLRPLLREAELDPDALSVVHVRPLQGLGMEDLLRAVQRDGPAAALVALPLVLVMFRVAVGLARVSAPERWRATKRGEQPPALRTTWHEARGNTWSGFGLWSLFVLMMLAATLMFAGPTFLLRRSLAGGWLRPAAVLLSGLTIGFLLVYGFLLSVLFQLAVHSLAQNRRGAGSALQHAWRIARNDVGATARATLVDAVLYFTVLLLAGALVFAQHTLRLPEPVLLVPYLGLLGFGGCARCAFWGRAYQTLGGISTWAGPDGDWRGVPARSEPESAKVVRAPESGGPDPG